MSPTQSEAKSPETMTGIRKAAIFLISVGEKASADIIRQLPEKDLQLVSTEITRLDGTIPAEQLEAVLEEFQQMKAAGDSVACGGTEYASKMLINAFGPAPAGRLMDRIVKTARTRDDRHIGALRHADPQQLAAFIQNEHPQTIALILSNLSGVQAGMLLMSLPAPMRPDITMRMANLDRISPEVFNRIVAVVGEKLKALGEVRYSGGTKVVAEMLNGIDSGAAKEIMSAIGQADNRLVEVIQHLMFVFDDILVIPKEAMKILLSRVDRKVLTLALKGTSTQLKNHFTTCMSQRGAEMLKEDMEALGPQRIRDVEAAQQQIITTVRQLQAEGLISLKGSAEQYVV
jgi:flagellar motor switch protein FliG